MAGAAKRDLLWRRLFAIFGSVVFLLVAPGSVAGFVPWWISQWRMHATSLRVGSTALDWRWLDRGRCTGIAGRFARFAWQGLGTPAPMFPTKRLVVTGLYRYVRNPIYCALIGMILGQGLLLAMCACSSTLFWCG